LIHIPKKRKSRGKSGSNKGHHGSVQCSNCGRFVPRSKAKAITRRTSLVDAKVYGELKKAGTIIMSGQARKWLCVSCAVHSHHISQRAKEERKEA